MTERSKITVFIAEDQEIARIGLQTLLSRFPQISVVGTAANGQDACRQCLTLKPDVVIMDLSMPVMNGIDATQLIRTELPSSRVLIITTHDSEEDVFAALGAGADGYCLKTALKEQVLTAIQTVADGGAWLDPGIADRVLRSLKRPAPNPNATSEPITTLSAREREVLSLIVDGFSNPEIAGKLFVSTDTVKTHIRHIMEKLHVSDRTQAAVKAVRNGIV